MYNTVDWIKRFWVDGFRKNAKFSPPARRYGFESLEERLALNAAPTFVDLPDHVTVIAGELFHLALNGSDKDGDALNFTVNSSSSQIGAAVLTGNQSVKMTISYVPHGSTERVYGDIIFELFEGDTPKTTERIIKLVQEGFYDDVIFHRIIDGFMMQGGDPTGKGTGGSDYGTFDDEIINGLIFSGKGLLGMANSGTKTVDGVKVGTNNSQFFITDAAAMHLNGAHTIFGFVTKGDDVRDAVTNVDTTDEKPNYDVIIEEMTLINDTQNGVLRILTSEATTGDHTITVEVSDGKGGTETKEIKLTVVAPPASTTKWEIPTAEMAAGGTLKFTLPEFDFPEDVTYKATRYSAYDSNGDLKYYAHEELGISITGREITFTASENVTGIQYVMVTAVSLDGWYSVSKLMPVLVSPAAPTISLSTNSDTGKSGDAITQANNSSEGVRFIIDNVSPASIVNPTGDALGVTLLVKMANVEVQYKVIETGTLENGLMRVIIETVPNDGKPWADGEHQLTVQQILKVTSSVTDKLLSSPISTPAILNVDTTKPVFDDKETTVYEAVVGQPLQIKLTATDRNQSSLTYKIEGENIPAGVQFNTETGLFNWTPGASDVRQPFSFTVIATDGAGNFAEKAVTISFQSGSDFSITGTTTIDEKKSFSLVLRPIDLEEGLTVDFAIVSSTLPSGANYELKNGESEAVFTWTTTEADGPGTYTIVFRLLDSEGNARTKSVTLNVNELNEAPTLVDDLLPLYTVDEHEPFSVRVRASDPDLHPGSGEKLTFSLQGEVPEGMSIDPDTGQIEWTPGEQHGGFSYEITVRVTDNAGAFAEKSFNINVIETDSPPVFEGDTDKFTAKSGEQFITHILARDPDYHDDPALRVNEIRYSLGPDAPEGMVINPITGEITWFIPAELLPNSVRSKEFSFEVLAHEIDGEELPGLHTAKMIYITVTNSQIEMFEELARQSGHYTGLSTDTMPILSALNSVFIEQYLYENDPSMDTLSENGPYDSGSYVPRYRSPFETSLGDEVWYGDDVSSDPEGKTETKEDTEKPQDSGTPRTGAGSANPDAIRGFDPREQPRPSGREQTPEQRYVPRLPNVFSAAEIESGTDEYDLALANYLAEDSLHATAEDDLIIR